MIWLKGWSIVSESMTEFSSAISKSQQGQHQTNTLGIVRFNKEISLKCNTAFLKVSLRLQARKHLPFFLQFGWEFHTDSRCRCRSHLLAAADVFAVLRVWSFRRGLSAFLCSGRQQFCTHYSEPQLLWNYLAPSEPGGTAENCLLWERKGNKGNNCEKQKGWFCHGLVSWTASLRQCWVTEHAEEKKCYSKWTFWRQSHTLGRASC